MMEVTRREETLLVGGSNGTQCIANHKKRKPDIFSL